MIRQWDLLENFTEDFPDRWRVVLHSDRDDVMKLASILNRLNFSCGRPTLLREKDFNWSFYVYQLAPENSQRLREVIAEFKTNPEEFSLEKYVKDQNQTVVEESLDEQPQEFALEEGVEQALPEEEFTEEQKADIGSELGLNPRYTFGSFVVGKNNHFAKAAALAVGEMPGKVYNPLFIYGDVGLGKTHLMHAIGHYVISVNPKAKVIYTTAERFMAEVIDAIRYGKIIEFRNKYRQMDVLLIDDVQFLSEAEAAQEEFYHTFNALYDDHKQIVVASDKPPKKISVLEERLRSRFEWGLITDIQLPNLETRVAILKAKADLTRIDIDNAVLYFIAEQLKSNIRELEGFLIRIIAYASLTKRQINKALAEELLHDLLPEEPQSFATSTLPPLDEVLPPREEPAPKQENRKEESIEEVSPVTIPSEEAVVEPPAEPAPKNEENVSALEPLNNETSATEVVADGMSQPPKISYEEEPPLTATPPLAQSPLPAQPSAEKEQVLSTPQPPPQMESVSAREEKKEDTPNTIRTMYFYPSGKDKDLKIMIRNFDGVIKKHRIKFILDQIFVQEYVPDASLDFPFLLSQCRAQQAELVIWMGPPVGENFVEGEFVRTIHSAFDREKIPLQYISFESVPKQYKYLNMVLDFAFLKKK